MALLCHNYPQVRHNFAVSTMTCSLKALIGIRLCFYVILVVILTHEYSTIDRCKTVVMCNYLICSVGHCFIFPTVQHQQNNEKNRLLFCLDSVLDVEHTPPMLYQDYTCSRRILGGNWQPVICHQFGARLCPSCVWFVLAPGEYPFLCRSSVTQVGLFLQ